MKSWLYYFLLLIGLVGIFSVRIFEEQWFYDPMLAYFRQMNYAAPLPSFAWQELITSHLLRFGLNLFFSALLLHGLFRNVKWTMMSATVMAVVFFLAFGIYIYCLASDMAIGHLFTFYIRRFVIQPVVLLLLIPLLYYLRYTQKQSTR